VIAGGTAATEGVTVGAAGAIEVADGDGAVVGSWRVASLTSVAA
jgi:hypothetical protein